MRGALRYAAQKLPRPRGPWPRPCDRPAHSAVIPPTARIPRRSGALTVMLTRRFNPSRPRLIQSCGIALGLLAAACTMAGLGGRPGLAVPLCCDDEPHRSPIALAISADGSR